MTRCRSNTAVPRKLMKGVDIYLSYEQARNAPIALGHHYHALAVALAFAPSITTGGLHLLHSSCTDFKNLLKSIPVCLAGSEAHQLLPDHPDVVLSR